MIKKYYVLEALNFYYTLENINDFANSYKHLLKVIIE